MQGWTEGGGNEQANIPDEFATFVLIHPIQSAGAEGYSDVEQHERASGDLAAKGSRWQADVQDRRWTEKRARGDSGPVGSGN